MTRLFRSKSCEFVGRTEFSPSPPNPFLCNFKKQEEEEEEFVGDDDLRKPISKDGVTANNQSHFAILDVVVEVLKKSLVTCSVEKDDDSSMDIGWPTEIRHVSHVTFDRQHGFLGLPSELEPEVPRSASAKGNCVPTILLSMQKQLYSEGGLKVEGIFRINAESSQEEYVRDQLNKGVVPHGTDVHCLSGLIKAWFRELPSRVLDSLTPEEVVNCNTEEDCANLVNLLPPTEAALLRWVINLMADVVEHQEFNKMNPHNIAMVFAPNMTQIVDPLTALTQAVQVVNFLKTLILKVLRERGKSNTEAMQLSSCSASPYFEADLLPVNFNSEEDSSARKPSFKDNFIRTSTLGRIEWRMKEKLWGCEGSECVVDESSPSRHEIIKHWRYRRCEGDHWLRLRKKIHKLWRHPVFLWNKGK
ncbi:hypothetical protein K1719_028690 [Acacia pycnantha]|nr:hypothetical protein K1719_028690 [Acacia pycnantha]